MTVLTLLATTALAANPPGLVNYQGVLRDASDAPLAGDHDMVFSFHDAETGGNEILLDHHTAGLSTAVTVSGGMFNVSLGGGAVTDGTGPGVYDTLAAVFRDHGEVWMEIHVAGEALSPRVRVVAAPFSLNADHLDGRDSSSFLDDSATTQTKSGPLVLDASALAANGIEATGRNGGGFFEDSDGTSHTYVARGTSGILAFGSSEGGYFSDTDGTGHARLAFGDYGLYASGSYMGAQFSEAGGWGYAYIAHANRGIEAYGSDTAGYFEDSEVRSRVWVANLDLGISAHGEAGGGYFKDTTTGSYVRVADAGYGIRVYGDAVGGTLTAVDSGTYVHTAFGTSSTLGNGAKNFVQNHPYDKDKVVVFAAIEGDEVGTYTRGSARLVGGVAQVSLGEAFRLVTNPDIGLTAQVTPRGPGAAVYVESVTTEELVVRAVEGFSEDAPFDYMVAGLRIGFEEVSVIRDKQMDAYLPSMEEDRQRYEQNPGLRQHNPLERYKRMRQNLGMRGELDLSASGSLRAAVGEFTPDIHVMEPELRSDRDAAGPETTLATEEAGEPGARAHASSEPEISDRGPASSTVAMHASGNREHADAVLPALTSAMPATEAMEAGDVVIFDPLQPGLVSLSRVPNDAALFGVVVEEPNPNGGPETGRGQVNVAHAGVVFCKVDAGYGAIRPGDLLTTSPTPGHAMLAVNPLPGTVLGKAIEPLETSAAVIRVLVTMR
jgi:hypothetical protein